jgi:hypothetical protein
MANLSLKADRVNAQKFKLDTTEVKPEKILFGDIAEDWFMRQNKTCGERDKSRNLYYLDVYILPKMKLFDLSEITAKIILNEILWPIEAVGKFYATRRVKSMISQSFRYSIALTDKASEPTIGH